MGKTGNIFCLCHQWQRRRINISCPRTTAVDCCARSWGGWVRTDQTTTTGTSRWVGGQLGQRPDRGKQCTSAAAEPGQRSNRIVTHATMTTTTTKTKGADDHDEKESPMGGKYARRAKMRRRGWRLPRRYVTQPSRLMTAVRHSCSWQRQGLQL
jgi:hypothetical protein